MPEEHLLVKVSQKALIVIDNKLLLTFEENDWEIPGGRINKGETNLIEALKREIAEELAVEIEPGEIYNVSLFTKPSGEQALAIVYQCELLSPLEAIKPREGEIKEWKLFTKEELAKLDNIYPNSIDAVRKFIDR